MEMLLQKLPNNCLAPMGDETLARLSKVKNGAMVRGDFAQMRNGKYFRKWWVLANYAFEIWADSMPPMEYRGQQVQPNFERFRKDLIILAGYYTPVFSARGDVRVEAASLQWASMSEEEFEGLYSATIQAVLTKILNTDTFTEEQLRSYVENVLRFD